MVRHASFKKMQIQQKERELRAQSAHSRRRFITYGAVGLGLTGVALGLGGVWYGTRKATSLVAPVAKSVPAQQRSALAVTFTDAQKDPTLRQAYLTQLIGTNTIPFCTGVVYDHDGSAMQGYYKKVGATDFIQKVDVVRGGDYDMKTPDVLNTAGRGESVPIFVGRQLFDAQAFAYMVPEDIRHVLIAHEGHHCHQHAQGLSYLSPEGALQGLNDETIHPTFWYFIAEQDAYLHDLPRLLRGEFKGSEYHVNDSKRRFIENGLNLTKASRIARPLELRLFQGVMEAIQKEPLLQDISIPSSYYEQRKRFK